MRASWLSAAVFASACVDAAAIDWPAAPAASRSALLLRECAGERTFYASSSAAEALVLVEPPCPSGRETWIAYLPLSLEALGWAPGPLSLARCEEDAEGCCVDRELSALAVDAVHRSNSPVSFEEVSSASWTAQLGRLSVASRCRCRTLRIDRTTSVRGVSRLAVAPTGDGHVLLVAARHGERESDPRWTSLHQLRLETLDTQGTLLELPEQPAWPGDGQALAVATDGRFVSPLGGPGLLVGTSLADPSVLPGPAGGPALRTAAPSPPGEQAPRIAGLSFAWEEPSRLYLHQDGQWAQRAAPEDSLPSCVSSGGRTNSGQRSVLLWRGADELLALPDSPTTDMANFVTNSRFPDGFWHLLGEELRWVDGPGLRGECLSSVAELPGYGLVFGTGRRGLQRWSEAGWAPLHFLRRGPQSPNLSDIWVFQPVPDGFLYGGREGFLSYVQDDVLCQEVQLSTQHLRSAVATEDGWVFATEARGPMADAQLIRVRLEP